MNNSLEGEVVEVGVDSSKVLELVLTKAKDFEAKHQNDITYQGTGIESIAHLVRYLLGVKKVTTRQKHILPPLDDLNRIRRLEERLDVFQSQSTQVNFALGKISEVLQTSNKLSSKRIELRSQKRRRKKTVPQSITLQCLKAELEIVSQFKAMRLNVTFSQGTSKAIYEGKFTWASPEAPTCVSPFTIELSKPNSKSIHDRHMVLSTLESHGKSMTPAKAEKSLKQSLIVPESFHELMDQGRVYVALLKILGGEDSDVAHKVEEVLKSLNLNKTKVEALIARNVETGGYILYQIGLKVNNYLEHSHSVSSPSEIP
eukprot:scaffold51757_cov42-Cyclotella_meneghiniana.AAC.16